MIGMNPPPGPLSNPDDTVPIAPTLRDDVTSAFPPPAPRRSGWRVIGAVLLVVALLGGGVGIGRLLDDDQGALATATTAAANATTTARRQ